MNENIKNELENVRIDYELLLRDYESLKEKNDYLREKLKNYGVRLIHPAARKTNEYKNKIMKEAIDVCKNNK